MLVDVMTERITEAFSVAGNEEDIARVNIKSFFCRKKCIKQFFQVLDILQALLLTALDAAEVNIPELMIQLTMMLGQVAMAENPVPEYLIDDNVCTE